MEDEEFILLKTLREDRRVFGELSTGLESALSLLLDSQADVSSMLRNFEPERLPNPKAYIEWRAQKKAEALSLLLSALKINREVEYQNALQQQIVKTGLTIPKFTKEEPLLFSELLEKNGVGKNNEIFANEIFMIANNFSYPCLKFFLKSKLKEFCGVVTKFFPVDEGDAHIKRLYLFFQWISTVVTCAERTKHHSFLSKYLVKELVAVEVEGCEDTSGYHLYLSPVGLLRLVAWYAEKTERLPAAFKNIALQDTQYDWYEAEKNALLSHLLVTGKLDDVTLYDGTVTFDEPLIHLGKKLGYLATVTDSSGTDKMHEIIGGIFDVEELSRKEVVVVATANVCAAYKRYSVGVLHALSECAIYKELEPSFMEVADD